MANYCHNCGVSLSGSSGTKPSTAKSQKATPKKRSKPAVKRAPTAYQVFIGKELKRLKKKHPRSKQTVLMKKAAKAWRAKKRGRR